MQVDQLISSSVALVLRVQRQLYEYYKGESKDEVRVLSYFSPLQYLHTCLYPTL